MNQHPIRPARLAGLISALVVSLVLVWSIPAASLPGLGATTEGWFREIDPADGLLAVLRILVLTGLAYLLAATLLLLASTAVRSSTVNRLAASCTGPALQRFLRVGRTRDRHHDLAAFAGCGRGPSPCRRLARTGSWRVGRTVGRGDDHIDARR